MLVTNGSGYCSRHQLQAKSVDARRGSSTQRGYGYKWQQARNQFLRQYPLCADHAKRGELKQAVVVDHIIPHCGDEVLLWDRNNWQSLCAECHSRKTATEDGGFGNPRQ